MGFRTLTTARPAKGYDVLATFDYGNSQYFLVNLPSGVAYGPGLFNANYLIFGWRIPTGRFI